MPQVGVVFYSCCLWSFECAFLGILRFFCSGCVSPLLCCCLGVFLQVVWYLVCFSRMFYVVVVFIFVFCVLQGPGLGRRAFQAFLR